MHPDASRTRKRGRREKPIAITVRMPESLVNAIDRVRGPIPRGTFTLWLVEEALKSLSREAGNGQNGDRKAQTARNPRKMEVQA